MLYDKRWDAKVEQKVDPLTLEALIGWLERQPAKKSYCYEQHGRCLAAQYNSSIGRKYTVVDLVADSTRLPFDIALERIACEEPHTFGAALERARAALR